MTEMFLSAVISTLTEKSNDFLVQEFTTELGVEQHRQKLCRILLELQAVVADAEECSRANPIVKGWLHNLKAILYESEDVLDDLRYSAMSKAVETEIQSENKAISSLSIPWSTLVGCSTCTGAVFDSSIKLKSVVEKFEAIVTEMNQFKFLSIHKPVDNQDRSHSFVLESTVIGRDDDLEKIVAVVLGQAKAEQEHVTVISIVGMGGLGKTTLAQLVSDDVRIQNNFDLTLLSVCIPGEFGVAHVAKSIIASETAIDEMWRDTMELIQHDLHEALKGKRYLLLLDDISNENCIKWEQMKHLLNCGRPGSMIIVTTPNQVVSNVMGTIYTHTITGLNEDHLWAIFRQRAFGMGVHERPGLVEIGKKLVMKCLGSPLLATILGGLMSFKKEEREWLDVLESTLWENVHVENEIFTPILKLCYLHLPSYMKRCFAFCTIFPKGCEIERDNLVQLWMANDFIPSQANMEIEVKGIEIFNELAWRGFFQHIKKKRKQLVFGGISLHTVCRMHGFIHDFGQSVVGTEYATLLNLDQQNYLSNETLHVSTCYKPGVISLMQRYSFIHTLLDFGYTTNHNEQILYSQQTCILDLSITNSLTNSLRAVSLHCASISYIEAIPGILKHLRYLDLSSCCFLMEIPESFCTLYSLQTLNLNNCRDLGSLPEGTRHMRSLRHLYLDGCCVAALSTRYW